MGKISQLQESGYLWERKGLGESAVKNLQHGVY